MLVDFRFFSWSAFALYSSKNEFLFFIERSKNKNLVQYDVRLTENDDILDSDPVSVYWILENGMQKELTLIQRKFAYRVDSYEKLGKNRLRFFLSLSKTVKSLWKRRKVLSEPSQRSMARWTGLPQVVYVDLFGYNTETGLPVSERMLPK